MDDSERREADVVVIGGGQSGLAVGYYLRRTGLDFVILDAQSAPGGAWRCGWESLRLFSPARWSSLPGWIMPGGPDWYPGRDDFVRYMTEYEQRYDMPIQRPVLVRAVRSHGDRLAVETDRGTWLARAVVSATGTWGAPIIPCYPAQDSFRGEQLHSAEYSSPLPFIGRRVLVVGGGNSGAQIVADLANYADVTWVTRREPVFLPDDVDGRDLFDLATERYLARQQGNTPEASEGTRQLLGDIVAVAPVREARDRGQLTSRRPFVRFTPAGVVWPDGNEEQVDAVIWCTGFRYALDVLQPLGVVTEEGVEVEGTHSVREPRLWLVGYGEWTGDASATIIGVGRTARQTAREIAETLADSA